LYLQTTKTDFKAHTAQPATKLTNHIQNTLTTSTSPLKIILYYKPQIITMSNINYNFTLKSLKITKNNNTKILCNIKWIVYGLYMDCRKKIQSISIKNVTL
jgi:hypothetical protein